MSISIDVGYTTDNAAKVNKNVTALKSNVTINPLSVLDQLSPTFVIDYDASLWGANYVECAALGRKYFCTVSSNTAQRMILNCSVDVLSSFDLSSCSITVIRNAAAGINIIPDTKLPVIPNKKQIDSYILSSDFFTKTDTNSYLLAVIGDD